jgi:hypothetical protein
MCQQACPPGSFRPPRGCRTRAAPCAQGGSRWALSGTPIQNSLGELFSLLHFLRYAPFDSQAAWRDLLRQAALADNLARAWARQLCLGSALARPRRVANHIGRQPAACRQQAAALGGRSVRAGG